MELTDQALDEVLDHDAESAAMSPLWQLPDAIARRISPFGRAVTLTGR